MESTDRAEPTMSERLRRYLGLAGRLTAGELLHRGMGFASRRIRRQILRLLDRHRLTYGRWEGLSLRPIFLRPAVVLSATLTDDVVSAYLDHRFDLLGSGWRSYRRSQSPEFANARISHYSGLVQSAIGVGPLGLHDYEPIEWATDIKSGHRWSVDTHFSRVVISPGAGIDIKMPWELSRMQHLVQMALAAEQGEESLRLVREIRAQILDFIASNPPRYGVNWACPMDIAIRVANWVLAVDMLQAKGVSLDDAFLKFFTRSIADHAAHVLANLEWSELPRSNHYLANVTGLLFAAASLAGRKQTDRWLGFATREFFKEILLQFHDDGGCYEASSGYHRLSAEMAVYGTALLAGLAEPMQSAIARPHARLPVRPPQDAKPLALTRMEDGRSSAIPPEIPALIARMRDLSAALTRGSGLAVMIGDQDSGRFCKPAPALSMVEGEWQEDSRDHRHLIAAATQLITTVGPEMSSQIVNGADAALVLALSKGRRFSGQGPQSDIYGELVSFGELGAVAAAADLLPATRVRRTVIDFRPGRIDRVRAFPKFGVYVLAGDSFHLCIRCFDPRLPGVYGHSHDDNLGIDLEIAGENAITDPGTYLYTPDPASRDLYRSASAHFVPRIVGRNAMTPLAPFAVRHDAVATCLHFGRDGFAGRLEGAGWHVQRLVKVGPDGFEIIDTCEGGELAPLASSRAIVRVTSGYGRKTKRSICIV